jgi:anti-sigma B factor antagonist
MNLVVDERPGGIAVASWAEASTLDASNVVELRQRVGEIERDHSRIVFDMSRVEFLDSSVIGALVGFMRKARAAGGDVKLAGLTPDIETIFELTRLQKVFQIHDSVDGAVREFGGATA